MTPIGSTVRGRRKRRPLVPHPTLPDVMLVPLTKGKFAMIDSADAAGVGSVPWVLSGRYASTSTRDHLDRRTNTSLHRFLWAMWAMPATEEIDHRNGDGLDCRRSNLRAATRVQNRHNRGASSLNTSGYKCVFWDRALGKWFAKVTIAKKHYHLGWYDTKEGAAEAYKHEAQRRLGEFARVA